MNNEQDRPIENHSVEEHDAIHIYNEDVKSPMEIYLEKRKKEDEKLGPAINAQGEVQGELSSPSLEQFKELHQQSQIGGR